MNNAGYLVAAYVSVWALVFAYLYSIARRQRALERDVQALRRAIQRAQTKE